MAHVFISYSHADEPWMRRLVTHLQGVVGREALSVWDDTRISPGSRWRAELDAAVRSASLAILLVSADFLSSEFIRKEEAPALLDRARRSEMRLLPILVRPCAWETVDWLRDLQMMPGGGAALSAGTEPQVDEWLARIATSVHRQVTESVGGDGDGVPA